MRHEFHRQAKLPGHFPLVHVPGQRVRHQVVAQLVRVVLVRRRGAGARIAGHAETHRRRGQQVLQRSDRQLHRGGVAARVADATLAAPALAGQLRQPVVPTSVEAVVGRQVDDQRVRAGLVECLHTGCRLAVGQRQHHHVGAQRGQHVVRRGGVTQLAGVAGHLRIHALAVQLARRDVGKLQRRVRRHQADQLRTGMTAGADDADGLAMVHGAHVRHLW